MTIRIIPAIMSGGAGTRLWPVSTEARPKQFHALSGGEASLFTETALRVKGAAGAVTFADPLILCNARHTALVRAHLAEAGVQPAALVLEPQPRNTAAVGAIAAALAQEIDADALVLLLPADHVIADAAGFRAVIERAAPFARERIVTFGITPDRPATGYGYIKRGERLGDGVFAIESFREKPNAETASAYLAGGGYSWNAGIFLFHPATLLAEFSASADVRDKALAALKAAERVGDEVRLDAAQFAQVPSQPLDIAVMEKTARAAVAPCEIGWADLGAWDEIWRVSPRDAGGNAVQGQAMALDASGNLLRGDGIKVCVAGVSDLVVIATPEAVVVIPRERAQDVKLLRELAAKL
ncbi:MAG TPA: sugar phosphate nucleotidyltransferase [Vitreimonas sp.]|uniref:mannose-1-phosphate guanylyltransferase n=1 Tax=Vitreimonas sp. TaxID=3069702 RepID=UPI002D72B986|nr:sugar phosphate nucleotidyltransferase [Vitreimonas sp.]HYD87741.1 sugar phosphate nucleotidyltransferase [Vitreimonas sp.]